MERYGFFIGGVDVRRTTQPERVLLTNALLPIRTSHIYLPEQTVTINCLIRSVDLAGSLAKCEFREDWSGDATENGLAGRLVRELDVLARVEGEDADGSG